MASAQFKTAADQSLSDRVRGIANPSLPGCLADRGASDRHESVVNSSLRDSSAWFHCDPIAFRFAPLVLAALLASGCDRSRPAGEFQSYDELVQKAEQKPKLTDAPRESSAVRNVPDSSANPNPFPDTQTPSNDPATSEIVTVEIPASALAPLNVVDGSSTSAIMKVADAGQRLDPVSALTALSGTTSESPDSAPVANPIQLLIPNKEFRAEGGNNIWRVSYDDLDLLKVLNMEPVPVDALRYFPGWLAELDGKQIRIRGFMFPTFESSGIEQFVLARDNQICCFGRNPKVYDLIAVTLKPGATTDYIPNRPFDVVGTLRIDLLAEEGSLLGLYWLDEAQVIDR